MSFAACTCVAALSLLCFSGWTGSLHPGVPEHLCLGHLCPEHANSLVTPLRSVFYIKTNECVIG